MKSFTLRPRSRGGSQRPASQVNAQLSAQPPRKGREDAPTGEGAGLRREIGRGCEGGTVGGSNEGAGLQRFSAYGACGPFCACAAHFKLRRPPGSGVCERQSQWARGALAPAAFLSTAAPVRSAASGFFRAGFSAGLPESGPRGLSPSTPCASGAGLNMAASGLVSAGPGRPGSRGRVCDFLGDVGGKPRGTLEIWSGCSGPGLVH